MIGPDNLPKIKVELVEEVKVEPIYDPNKDFIKYVGKAICFGRKNELDRISDLVLMQDKSLILDSGKNGRPYLRRKKVRMMAGIESSLYEEAFNCVSAIVTPWNKGNLTKFINENGQKPAEGLCLIVGFETPSGKLSGNYKLGMITPPINYIENEDRIKWI